MASAEVLSHSQRVIRLYRNSLKHLLSWAIDRGVWREHAVAMRARFDANKDLMDLGKARKLLEDGEAEFEMYKHPDPYICK